VPRNPAVAEGDPARDSKTPEEAFLNSYVLM
jgi:hypothetical protein